MALSAAEVLGKDGPFAQRLSNYEERLGQLQMASAVERALDEERVLLCEAGTGTGKTLAYLVPALASGKRVVISTATKALQAQIADKDIPLIARTLGVTPRVAVMQGLSNYLCRRRFGEFLHTEAAQRPQYARALGVLGSWVQESETGELAELAGLSESDPIFSHVASSADTRVGARCMFFDECFVTRMRRQAAEAQLIIVNHHLFFADLALRGPHPASVLPDYDAVVFDEAHRIEDVAGLFFGQRVSKLRTTRLVNEIARAAHIADRSAERIVCELELRFEKFWDDLARKAGGLGPRITLEHDAWQGASEAVFFALDQALAGVGGWLEQLLVASSQEGGQGLRAEVVELLSRRTANIRDAIAAIVEGGRGTVTWLESSPLALSRTPVDLAPIFQERVFASIPSVVLTSATLTTGASSSSDSKAGTFSYVRRRLGLNEAFEALELEVESPFDFENKAILYTPKDLPPARNGAFVERAAERIAELVALTDGGAFVLTTSIASMKGLYQRLQSLLAGRLLLLQGQGPKHALVSAFKAAGDAVLVATQSFWEGVDIPGHSLRLVVLEKLPFMVPSDPIVRARALALEREGRNAFMDLFVPGAAISLKQGFGRLIRTRHDAGIVALLDERVHTKSYSKRLLRALPPVRRADHFGAVAEFWSAQSPDSRGCLAVDSSLIV